MQGRDCFREKGKGGGGICAWLVSSHPTLSSSVLKTKPTPSFSPIPFLGVRGIFWASAKEKERGRRGYLIKVGMSGVGGKNEGVDFQLRGHTTSMLILFHVWEFGVCIPP